MNNHENSKQSLKYDSIKLKFQREILLRNYQ